MSHTPQNPDSTAHVLSKEEIRASLQKYVDTMQPYWLSLGRFVHTFAELESILSSYLFTIAGVTNEVGKSVFSGGRLKGCMDYINRILEATKQETLKGEVKHAFDQISLILKQRDDLLHYGANYDPRQSELILSTNRSSHVASKARNYAVDPSILDDMTFDIDRIFKELWLVFGRTHLTPERIREYEKERRQPWRYKQPPLIAPAGARRQDRSKQQPQLPPSHER